MKKEDQVAICANIDIISTVIFFGWLAILLQKDSLAQLIIVIILILICLVKMFIWTAMLEIYKTKNVKGYATPEVSVDIGEDTYKIKVVNEGEE